jgi:hypothetical protein
MKTDPELEIWRINNKSEADAILKRDIVDSLVAAAIGAALAFWA